MSSTSVAAGSSAPLIATAPLSDHGSCTPIALFVIAAAVLTIVAVGMAEDGSRQGRPRSASGGRTRPRDLADVEQSAGAVPASAHPADARTA
ncbi:hypothetical protein [Streptomyces blattellae]|uniref:hypothetical protein n=1 Tax=Streptomyces blattellae TaxID=2569855 RepID=UPI0018ACBB46|nr:hypothetical protein [Streptomyces blattellae]